VSFNIRKLGCLGEFRNGLNYSKANFGHGLKVISVKDFGDRWRPDLTILDEIDPAGLRVEQSDLRAGDILFVRSNGNKELIGRSMLIQEDLDDVSFSGFCIRFRPTTSETNSRFLSLYFRTRLFRRTLSQDGTGTNINNLNQPILERMDVPCPAKIVQERIVDAAGAYDDLIENNRRRIGLLEEAARMLYREWFVYFRFPGHEHVKITNGLPDGWERRSIGEMTDFLGRGISPSYDDEAEFFVVNQKCVRDRMLSMSPARRQKKEFPAKKSLQFLDVLINSTGTGTLGRVAQCWFEPSSTTFDSHVTVARANGTVDPYWFGYSLLELESVFEGMGDGATNQKELGQTRIASTHVITPPLGLQKNFGLFGRDSSRQIQVLVEQNEKLAQARDLLLPRLMNGEIAV
jgi:type I restriction enzyme S subunit